MNKLDGTSVPKNSAVPVDWTPCVETTSIHVVTLRTSSGSPLFRSTALASSPHEAASQVQVAYSYFIAAIGMLRDLRADAALLEPDAARTLVVQGTGSETCQIACFVWVAGTEKEDGTASRLPHAEAIALLAEPIDADLRMVEILTAGGTIDLCAAHTRSPRSGWITIDCTFRTSDATGQAYVLRPASTALRMAARLIVLCHLLSRRETVPQPLALRWAATSYRIPSATLRAARRMQGLQRPDAIIAWLRDHGHAVLAADVEREMGT